MFKRIALTLLLISLIAGSSAALLERPVQSVVDPIHHTLFVPHNIAENASEIKVFKRISDTGSPDYDGWQEMPGRLIPLAGAYGAPVYGLAVNQAGNKLFAATSRGNYSRLYVYTLDDEGLPNGDFYAVAFPAEYQSMTNCRGIALAGDPDTPRVYVVNAGARVIDYFDYDSGSGQYAHAGTLYDLAGSANLSGIAVGKPDANGDYKIYVSKNSSPGRVYIFNYTNGSISKDSAEIDSLQNPTFLKVSPDGTRLYVANNSVEKDDGDVRVYNTSDNSLLARISCGFSENDDEGKFYHFGWTGIDLSVNGKYLYFTQRVDDPLNTDDRHRQNLYWINTQNISGGALYEPDDVKNATGINDQNINGVVVSADNQNVIISDSMSGFKRGYEAAQDPNNFPWDQTALAPEFISIVPDSVTYGQGTAVTITGKNFFAYTSAYIVIDDQNEPALADLQVESPTTLTGTVPDFVKVGRHGIRIQNSYIGPYVLSDTASDVLTVNFSGAPQNFRQDPTHFYSNTIRWTWDLMGQGEIGHRLYDENDNYLQSSVGEFDDDIDEGFMFDPDVIPNTKLDAVRKVRAQAEEGILSEFSNTAEGWLAADRAIGLTATAQGPTSVRLRWDDQDNPPETEYQVQRHIGQSYGTVDRTFIVTGNSVIDDQGLLPDTYYSYEIRSRNLAYDAEPGAGYPEFTSWYPTRPLIVNVKTDPGVIPPPEITLVYPNRAPTDTTQTVVIEGDNFRGIPRALLTGIDPDIEGTFVALDGMTKLTYTFDLGGAAAGLRDVVVINPDNQSATLESGFEVMVGPEADIPENKPQATGISIINGNGQCTLGWTYPADTDMAEVKVVRSLANAADYPAHDDPTATVIYPPLGETIVPKPGETISGIVDSGLINDSSYRYVVYLRDTSNLWSIVVEGENAGIGEPSESATSTKDFSITYLAEGQGDNWISVPFNSPQVSGTPITTIGELMDSLAVFTPQAEDIMMLSWYGNATQAITSVMRNYDGTTWIIWDSGAESQPLQIGSMYILTISNPFGRPIFTETWTVSGNIPSPGDVTFDFAYLGEDQNTNWMSTPNESSLSNKGDIMTSLAGPFTPELGDIMMLSTYDNATQAITSIMRDYDGLAWNSWDPGAESVATSIGDPFIVIISNASGRTTFTVTWP